MIRQHTPPRGTFWGMPDKPNAAIELHDSVVAEISRLEGNVEITLRPAYVHQSAGQPGVDDGIGLVQDVVISVEERIGHRRRRAAPQPDRRRRIRSWPAGIPKHDRAAVRRCGARNTDPVSFP